GSIEYSGVSGKIDFKPQSHYGQIYGAQVGENHGVLGGNYVIGEAALLPPAGIDYGNIWEGRQGRALADLPSRPGPLSPGVWPSSAGAILE
ncbi:hypothetical protein KQ726_15170, partial [Listeria monocytogenes]|nr:hypothetical protein [Listeria monocytogenes]